MASLNDVNQLPIPDPEDELQYVMNAVRTIRRELKGEVPLIGFWQPLDTRHLYGGGELRFKQSIYQNQKMLYAEPHILHRIAGQVS